MEEGLASLRKEFSNKLNKLIDETNSLKNENEELKEAEKIMIEKITSLEISLMFGEYQIRKVFMSVSFL